MKQSEAKELIEKLSRDIDEHNRRYYVLNQPTISDFEFDLLAQRNPVASRRGAMQILEKGRALLRGQTREICATLGGPGDRYARPDVLLQHNRRV